MEVQNLNLEIREETPNRSPKVILERLNINKGDNILILEDKIYIEIIKMTGQRSETKERNLVVSGGKTYRECKFQDTYNGNVSLFDSPAACSLLYDKNKNGVKTHLNNTQNGNTKICCKPLQQINGNVKPKNTIDLSVNCSQAKLSEPKDAFWSLDQSCNKHISDYNPSHIKSLKSVKSNGMISVLIKPLKRLNRNSSPSLFGSLKSLFSLGSTDSRNSSNPIPKSKNPFHNWCNTGVVKTTYCDRSRNGGLKSPRDFLPEYKVSQISKGLLPSCKVTLERVDAKICFMDYLRLKPAVRTDVSKMRELSLLRKYNIRNCHVVISRQAVEARRKT